MYYYFIREIDKLNKKLKIYTFWIQKIWQLFENIIIVIKKKSELGLVKHQ